MIGWLRWPVLYGSFFFGGIFNVHVNKKCAEQPSRCINLLLLLQCLCTQEGVHLIASDFKKGCAEEQAYRGLLSKRRLPTPWSRGHRMATAPLCWPQLWLR